MCLYNIILVQVFITQELVYVISAEIGLWAGWSVVQIQVEARDLLSSLKCPDQLWVPPYLLINGYPSSLWG
jgi:hypothetical protein